MRWRVIAVAGAHGTLNWGLQERRPHWMHMHSLAGAFRRELCLALPIVSLLQWPLSRPLRGTAVKDPVWAARCWRGDA